MMQVGAWEQGTDVNINKCSSITRRDENTKIGRPDEKIGHVF